MSLNQPQILKSPTPKLQKIVMQLTTKCNANCNFCMNGGCKTDLIPFQQEKYKNIISNITGGRVKNVELETIAFTGGEPLLEKDLLLDLAKFNMARGLKTFLISNAILMDYKLAQELYSSGVKSSRISLDTNSEVKYAQIRGVQNAFTNVLKGIEAMVENNIHVIIRFTLTRENMGDLIKTYKLCRELNVNEFQVKLVFPHGRADLSFMPSIMECEQAFNQLFMAEDKSLPISTPCFFLGPCSGAKIPHRMKACPCGREWIYITIDGSIYPCNYFPQDTYLGDFYSDDISLLWEQNKLIKEIRETIPLECSKCNNWENCYNQCQGLVYSLTNSFNQTCIESLKNVLNWG